MLQQNSNNNYDKYMYAPTHGDAYVLLTQGLPGPPGPPGEGGKPGDQVHTHGTVSQSCQTCRSHLGD